MVLLAKTGRGGGSQENRHTPVGSAAGRPSFLFSGYAPFLPPKQQLWKYVRGEGGVRRRHLSAVFKYMPTSIIFSLANNTRLFFNLLKIVATVLNFTCHLLISHNDCLNVYFSSLNALKDGGVGVGTVQLLVPLRAGIWFPSLTQGCGPFCHRPSSAAAGQPTPAQQPPRRPTPDRRRLGGRSGLSGVSLSTTGTGNGTGIRGARAALPQGARHEGDFPTQVECLTLLYLYYFNVL